MSVHLSYVTVFTESNVSIADLASNIDVAISNGLATLAGAAVVTDLKITSGYDGSGKYYATITITYLI